MKKRRAYAAAAFVAVLWSASVFAKADITAYNWYFKPNITHEKPLVVPEAANEIAAHDVIYTDPRDEKRLYLTFDAGYENGNVEKIVDTLKEKNAPATFFILPEMIKNHTALVKRMKDEGHLVGNHSTHHRDMTKYSDYDAFSAELGDIARLYEDTFGYPMDTFFRPPEGRFCARTLEYAEKCGYRSVFWSLAYADWDNDKQMPPDKALALLLSRTHPGAVVLLHPTSATNAAILGDYIDAVRADGYTVCPLTDFPTRERGGEA